MRRLALAVLLVSSGAAATVPGSPLIAVRGELSGAVATFRVRYVYDIKEPGYGSLIDSIEVPHSGLVTAATVRRNGVTRRLDLVDSEQAAKSWYALSVDEPQLLQAPGAQRSAVLIAGAPGGLTVSITTPRSGRAELEIEVAMPTCFFRDARYVVLPESWGPHLGALKTIAKPSSELTAACGSGGGIAEGPWVSFASPEVARRASGERLSAFAGRLVAGDDHIVRVEVDIAGTLADVPRDLATVLVVDASRSMTDAQREAQRELVMSYVRNAKETRVQVIAYARKARPLLPSWTIASRAAGRIDRELRALAPRNGSNVDSGLEEAGAWLARIEGTRRVVLVTDELLSTRLQGIQAATLKRVLPAGTLVHVVSTVGGADGVNRDDSVELGALAAATDGIAVRVLKSATDPIDATMLVKPISLDQIVVTAPGWSQIIPSSAVVACGSTDDDHLDEGHSCTWWGHGDVTSGPVAIAGLVWGTRVSRVLTPDPTRKLEVARELSLSASIEDDLLQRIESIARGVNRQWSLYSEWGGSGRYHEGMGGIGIRGTSCCGGSSSSHPSIGIGTIGRRGHEPDDLTAQLAPAVAVCQLDGKSAHVTIEMTLLEIVDVSVGIEARTTAHPNELRKLTECVEEVIWDASPMLRVPRSHSQHTAIFGKR